MSEPRHTLERTIREIEKLVRAHKNICEREGGRHWLNVLNANKEVLEILKGPEPNAGEIRRLIESKPRNFGGSAWYEVRMMIWLWEDADRGEYP